MEALRPVEELAESAGLKSWELAGLRRATGWAPGKSVTESEFDEALRKFRARPQGGGGLSPHSMALPATRLLGGVRSGRD